MVRCEGLEAGYRRGIRKRVVLRGVSFSLCPGEITALTGSNGSGKTTILRLILGLLTPWRGQVLIDGTRPNWWRSAHGIGFLPEHPVSLPGWTAQELLVAGWSRSDSEGPAEVPSSRNDADPFESSRLGDLSRGQQREVLRCYALSGTPGLVLLDEPWSGLDGPARARLRSALDRLRREGATLLVSSHEEREVREVADRFVALPTVSPSPTHQNSP